VITTIIVLVLAILAGDTLYSRARLHLRIRAAQRVRKHDRGLGPEGWSRVDSVRQAFGRDVGEVGEIGIDDNLGRFDSLLNNNHRRPR
jgi:hypothetical protein